MTFLGRLPSLVNLAIIVKIVYPRLLPKILLDTAISFRYLFLLNPKLCTAHNAIIVLKQISSNRFIKTILTPLCCILSQLLPRSDESRSVNGKMRSFTQLTLLENTEQPCTKVLFDQMLSNNSFWNIFTCIQSNQRQLNNIKMSCGTNR